MNRTVKLISLAALTGLIGFAGLKFIPQSSATSSLGAAATFESDFDHTPEQRYAYATYLDSHGNVNVRSGPGTNFAVNYTVPNGAAVTLHNDDIDRQGYRWYYLSFEDYAFTGWVREDLIHAPGGETGGHRPEQYVVLDSKYSNARINVRSGPGTNYRVQHYGLSGDQVEIFDSADGRDGYVWYKLAFVDSGAKGWVRQDLLAFIED